MPSPIRRSTNRRSAPSPTGRTSARTTVRNSVAVELAIPGNVLRSPEASRGIDLMTRWLQPVGSFWSTWVPGAIRTSSDRAPPGSPAAARPRRHGASFLPDRRAANDRRKEHKTHAQTHQDSHLRPPCRVLRSVVPWRNSRHRSPGCLRILIEKLVRPADDLAFLSERGVRTSANSCFGSQCSTSDDESGSPYRSELRWGVKVNLSGPRTTETR